MTGELEITRAQFAEFYNRATDREASLLDGLIAMQVRIRQAWSLSGSERLHVSGRELAEDLDRCSQLSARLAAAVQATRAFAQVDCHLQAAILALPAPAKE